jgi:GT2 family glycosyltransferase
MRIVVIVPTVGRKELVNRLLAHLELQRRLPDEVIVSAPDATHVEPYEARRLNVSYVFGRRGLCAQRNDALDQALPRADVITFIDDDFLPADDYLQVVCDLFAAHPDWAVVTGRVVHDGVHSGGTSFADGLARLRLAQAGRPSVLAAEDRVGAYGCNMSIRSAMIGDNRFDERLVLYGWQEDIDFSSRLRRRGRIVAVNTAFGVHLGISSGRVSGVRLGYSQVANPAYLIRKGTMPLRFALELMGRNLTANLAKSVWPEAHVDRRGRLKGNLLALFHLARGRIEPEYVLGI